MAKLIRSDFDSLDAAAQRIKTSETQPSIQFSEGAEALLFPTPVDLEPTPLERDFQPSTHANLFAQNHLAMNPTDSNEWVRTSIRGKSSAERDSTIFCEEAVLDVSETALGSWSASHTPESSISQYVTDNPQPLKLRTYSSRCSIRPGRIIAPRPMRFGQAVFGGVIPIYNRRLLYSVLDKVTSILDSTYQRAVLCITAPLLALVFFVGWVATGVSWAMSSHVRCMSINYYTTLHFNLHEVYIFWGISVLFGFILQAVISAWQQELGEQSRLTTTLITQMISFALVNILVFFSTSCWCV